MSDISALIGSPAGLTISDAEDNVIVKEGEIITPQVIDAARDAGRLNELITATMLSLEEEEGIQPAPKYVEIGEENPPGVHPESR